MINLGFNMLVGCFENDSLYEFWLGADSGLD